MMFLERNLEQLTVVQRQLVEQNSSLKKEVAIAERKLIARNERIQSLESLLQDSQEKLTAANHRYVFWVWRCMWVNEATRANVKQLRIPAHSRQGAPRGGQGRIDTRPFGIRQRGRIFRVWRRCWIAHCQAAAWRRRFERRRPDAASHWQPAEAGRRGRGEQDEAHELVLQPAVSVAGRGRMKGGARDARGRERGEETTLDTRRRVTSFLEVGAEWGVGSGKWEVRAL
jgi:hypothetical protein